MAEEYNFCQRCGKGRPQRCLLSYKHLLTVAVSVLNVIDEVERGQDDVLSRCHYPCHDFVV